MGWWTRQELPRQEQQADAETMRSREQVAAEVRFHLACAGLPVLPDGLLPGQGVGAVVHVDTREQVTGSGVWIGWSPAPVVAAAAGTGTERGAAAAAYGRAVVEAMSTAIRDVLGAGGRASTVTFGEDLSYTVCVVA